MPSRFSLTGWNSAYITKPFNAVPAPAGTGGTTNPGAPANTANDLKTSTAGLNDPTLGSRGYTNPLTGNRQVVAQGSVYLQPQVPAFLTQAINDLNDEQARKRMMLSEWQSNLLKRYDTAGANAYLLAPALTAMSAQPGSSVTLAGSSIFQNPVTGQAQKTVADATDYAKRVAASAPQSMDYEIGKVQQQLNNLPTGFGTGQQRYDLQQQLMDLQRKRTTANAPLGAAATGWVSGIR